MNRSKVLLFVGLVASSGMSLLGCKDKVGPKPPAFKIPAVGGGECDLAAQKGKVVLLEFWSYRCPYCRKEVAQLKKVGSKIDPKKVVIFSVHSFGGAKMEPQLAKFDFGPNVKVCMGDRELIKKYKDLPKPYGIHGVPHMLLLDKTGHIRRSHRGLTKADKLLEGINKYAN